jgi:hypothetical protein
MRLFSCAIGLGDIEAAQKLAYALEQCAGVDPFASEVTSQAAIQEVRKFSAPGDAW